MPSLNEVLIETASEIIKGHKTQPQFGVKLLYSQCVNISVEGIKQTL